MASCSVDAVDPSPAMKQLMHDSGHSALFSADFTHQCSVTVLPLYVFMVYTGTVLSVTVILESWNTVLIQQYCVVSKQRMLLSDDLYPTGMLGNLCAFWFSLCVMLIY